MCKPLSMSESASLSIGTGKKLAIRLTLPSSGRLTAPLKSKVKFNMAFSFATAQVIAVLFTAGGSVHVAVENAPPPHHFYLENSDSGAAALAAELVPLRDMSKEPIFCIGVAPGAKLEGVLAEELLSAPVRRFLLAQPMYQSFAHAAGMDPNLGQTLILACRKQFARG